MTGRELFIFAMDLCGLLDQGGVCKDTSDLEQRALSMINILLAENAISDCKIRKIEHTVPRLHSLDDLIDCCDIICYSVLPYGLARLLMLGEDDDLASDMDKLYGRAREKAESFGRAKRHSITEVY